MRSRPPPYFYGQGFVLVFGGVLAFLLGIQLWEMEPFLLSLGCLVLAIAYFAYLAWWRRSYSEWNPDEPDTEISFIQRLSDGWSMRAVMSVARIVPRRK